HALLLGASVASGAGVTVRSAHAGDEPDTESTRRGYRIPAGPLGPALSSFAALSGVLLSAEPALTQGKTTRGLSGDFTREEGLASLLVGTGLEWAPGPGGTYIVRPTALAQATPEAPVPTDEQPVELDPITVTAQPIEQGFKADFQTSATKTPLSIRETPQSVSVITQDSLKARQVQDLGQALETAAGVLQFTGTGPFAGESPFGFDKITVRGMELDGSFNLLEDGFISPTSFYKPDLALYERVEVIKGPSSTLYGRGSPGGLVNRVRKKPLAEFRGRDRAVRRLLRYLPARGRRHWPHPGFGCYPRPDGGRLRRCRSVRGWRRFRTHSRRTWAGVRPD
ncbi:MAG: TonB-dependent siderophore receptor, partial [Gammaproteobacteria bacterium]